MMQMMTTKMTMTARTAAGAQLLRANRAAAAAGATRRLMSDDARKNQNVDSGGDSRKRQGGRGPNKGNANRNSPDQRSTYRKPLIHPILGLRPDNELGVQVGERPNAGLVPLDMRDEIWRLHTTDPDGKGDIVRMSNITGLPVPKIQGIIKLRQYEKDYERDKLGGQPLDQTLDQEFRNIFGEKRSWRQESFTTEAVKARLAGTKIDYEFYREEEGPSDEGLSPVQALRAGQLKPWRVIDQEKIYGKEVKRTSKFIFRKVEPKPNHLRGGPTSAKRKKHPLRLPVVH